MRSIISICVLLSMGLALSSCSSDPISRGVVSTADPSIVLSRGSSADDKVENGFVFDKATVNLDGIAKVIIPSDAKVIQQDNIKEMQIFTIKAMSFYGHPPEEIRLHHVRKYLGCATQRNSSILKLATFGEWDSKEGRVSIRILLILPAGMEIIKATDHSGSNSNCNSDKDYFIASKHEKEEGWWYGVTKPSSDWSIVKDYPDPERRANK